MENITDLIHELNEKARKSKSGKIAKSYLAEASSLTKLMKAICHNISIVEDRKVTCNMELSEITHYLLVNNLITEDKLSELRTIARNKAKQKNEETQKEIDKLYKYFGDYTFNRTKADKTADAAIRRVDKNEK